MMVANFLDPLVSDLEHFGAERLDDCASRSRVP